MVSRGGELRRNHPDPQADQDQPSKPTYQLTTGSDLLQQDEDGKPTDPQEIHDSTHEQQRHQGPAAAGTVAPVLEPHPQRSPGTLSPFGGEKTQG